MDSDTLEAAEVGRLAWLGLGLGLGVGLGLGLGLGVEAGLKAVSIP